MMIIDKVFQQKISYNRLNLLLILLSTFLCIYVPVQGGWVNETIISPGNGKFSVIYDSMDHPHILSGGLNGEIYLHNDGTKWIREDIPYNAQFISRIIFDSSEQPVFCYVTPNPLSDEHINELKYARKTNTGWISEIIDRNITSIKLDSFIVNETGTPYIAYAKKTGRTSSSILYAYKPVSAWENTTIETGSVNDPLITINQSGYPDIIYTYYSDFDGTSERIYHAYYSGNGYHKIKISQASILVELLELKRSSDNNLSLIYNDHWYGDTLHISEKITGHEWSVSTPIPHGPYYYEYDGSINYPKSGNASLCYIQQIFYEVNGHYRGAFINSTLGYLYKDENNWINETIKYVTSVESGITCGISGPLFIAFNGTDSPQIYYHSNCGFQHAWKEPDSPVSEFSLLIPENAPIKGQCDIGDTLSFIVEVVNSGSTSDLISLSSDTPNVTFSTDDVTLNPGEKKSIIVEIEHTKENQISRVTGSSQKTGLKRYVSIPISMVNKVSKGPLHVRYFFKTNNNLELESSDFLRYYWNYDFDEKLTTLNILFDYKYNSDVNEKGKLLLKGVNDFSSNDITLPLSVNSSWQIISSDFDIETDEFSFTNPQDKNGKGFCYYVSLYSINYYLNNNNIPKPYLKTSEIPESVMIPIFEKARSKIDLDNTIWTNILAPLFKYNADSWIEKVKKSIQDNVPCALVMNGESKHTIIAYKFVETDNLVYFYVYDPIWNYPKESNFELSISVAMYNKIEKKFSYISQMNDGEKKFDCFYPLKNNELLLCFGCPINLSIHDQYGRTIYDTGISSIPNSSLYKFQEQMIFSLPNDLIYDVNVTAYDSGFFNFSVNQINTSSYKLIEYNNIKINKGTKVIATNNNSTDFEEMIIYNNYQPSSLKPNNSVLYIFNNSIPLPSDTYTITATSFLNGTIIPSGAIQVPNGSDQCFTITPDPGYYIKDVQTDNTCIGAVDLYIFRNVTINHTISANFTSTPGLYQINASADLWTKAYPSGNKIYPAGSNSTYITQPKPGSDLLNVTIDTVPQGTNSSWIFPNIGANHSLLSTGQPTPGQVHVSFSYNISVGKVPLIVAFTDQSLGSPYSWFWDFGDGNTSTYKNPVHIYTISGVYPVSLRATNNQSSGIGVHNKAIEVTDE